MNADFIVRAELAFNDCYLGEGFVWLNEVEMLALLQWLQVSFNY